MARGSIVDFRPSAPATTAQVLHAAGTTVVVSRLGGPELAESPDEWTMRPLSHKAVLPELLGMEGSDH